MTYYEKEIIKATGCTPLEVRKVEEIMRSDVVHSTLDWLSFKQFKRAAQAAYDMFLQINYQV